MELNGMKLGIHFFQLEKGDRFETNGSFFSYYPVGDDNKLKCPRSSGYYSRGHRASVSAKKFQKDVLKADNIELIKNEHTGTGANGKEHWYKVWEVKYAYKVEVPKNDTLVVMGIKLNDYKNSQWEFEVHEMEVERITAQNYFLAKSHPITYHSQIPKTELDNVHSHYGTFHIIGRVEDYAMLEDKLYMHVENTARERVETAEKNLQKKKDDYAKFQQFKSEKGYA